MTQYLLAVDRANQKVIRFYDNFHPAVVRCLNDFARKAETLGKRINVCGEIAGDPLGALMLLSLGYTSLSMNYSYISRIKYILRRVSFTQLRELGEQALKLTDSSSIRALYDSYATAQGLGKIVAHKQMEGLDPNAKHA